MDAPVAAEKEHTPPVSPPPTVNLNSILPSIEVQQPPDEAAPLRVIAFDTQSICAQLFGKQLLNHLRIGQISHPYVLAATLGPERIHTDIGNEHTRRLWEGRVAQASQRVKSTTYEVATNNLLRQADKLENEGKTVFITEYPPFIMNHQLLRSALSSTDTVVSKLTNPTTIPEELLKLLTPLIFIQHPALTLPAWLRLAKAEYGSYPSIEEEDFTIWTSLRWSRILFDYLRSTHHHHRRRRQDSVVSSNGGKGEKWEPGYVATKPYVIDAADVAANTHAMLAATCRLLGIQYADVSPSWARYFEYAASAFKRAVPSGLARAFSNRLQGSQGVHINISEEQKSWEREFGAEVAALLRRKVEEEMGHYNYLRNFRVRILPSLTTGLSSCGGGQGQVRRSSAITMTTTPRDLEGSGEHPLRIVRSAIDQPRRVSHA